MTVHQLVRLYPRVWRERYGEEFVEIVGDRHLSGQQLVDVVMGAIDAWSSRRVRAGARGSAASTAGGGEQMIQQLKMRCATSEVRYTKTDALISAGVLILGTVLLLGAGIVFDRQNYPVLGDVMKSLAFPAATVASMPFAILKGQPRKAQLVSTIGPLVILFAATWIATKI
jgi:hypothetical protein